MEKVCHWGRVPGWLYPATIPLSMFLVLQESKNSPCSSLPPTPDVLPKNRRQRDQGLNSEILSSEKELLIFNSLSFFLFGILSRKSICFHDWFLFIPIHFTEELSKLQKPLLNGLHLAEASIRSHALFSFACLPLLLYSVLCTYAIPMSATVLCFSLTLNTSGGAILPLMFALPSS